MLSSGVGFLGQLPSRLNDGFNFPFRELPGFDVLSENLPDIYLLEPFVFPTSPLIIFTLSEAVGQLNPGHLVNFC